MLMDKLVVMDNLLSAHKGARVRQLVEERGCELCCTYPTLLFSGLKPHRAHLLEDEGHPQKGILRKAEARSREALALIEAMGRALEAITPRDAKGFFEYCGYRLPVQSF